MCRLHSRRPGGSRESLWVGGAQHAEAACRRSMKTGSCRSAAIEELADVVICALSFANRSGIDVTKAVKQKVEKNAKKYPVAIIRGSFDLNDAPFQNLYFNHVIKETKDRPLAMSLPEGHKELV